MGSVARAVLEFDEAVQVPWRPPLASVQVPWRPPLASVPALAVVRGGGSAPRGRGGAARAARLAPPGRPIAPRRPQPAAVARAGGGTCARCGSAEACSPGALRLTRRARRLLAAVLTGSAVAVAAWSGAFGQQDDGLRLAANPTTVVRSGDTLWSIARTVAGDDDVRGVVDEIQRLNGLRGSSLTPGQVLELP